MSGSPARNLLVWLWILSPPGLLIAGLYGLKERVRKRLQARHRANIAHTLRCYDDPPWEG